MDNLPTPYEDENMSLDIIENEEFLRWIQDDSVILSESLNSMVDNIIRDKRKKIQIFLLALFRNRIDKLTYLFSQEDTIRDELFKEDRIKAMTTNQLISVFKMLHVQASDILEFLDYISQQPIDTLPLKTPQDEVTSKLAHLSPESRNKLRTVLAMLVEDDKKKKQEDAEASSQGG